MVSKFHTGLRLNKLPCIRTEVTLGFISGICSNPGRNLMCKFHTHVNSRGKPIFASVIDPHPS